MFQPEFQRAPVTNFLRKASDLRCIVISQGLILHLRYRPIRLKDHKLVRNTISQWLLPSLPALYGTIRITDHHLSITSQIAFNSSNSFYWAWVKKISAQITANYIFSLTSVEECTDIFFVPRESPLFVRQVKLNIKFVALSLLHQQKCRFAKRDILFLW